jgi:hypothetical protein
MLDMLDIQGYPKEDVLIDATQLEKMPTELDRG